MPSANTQRPRTNSRRRKRRRKRRGPVMRFKFSRFILIWVFCLIIAFLMYMASRNLHPEKDVFIDKPKPEESSVTEVVTPAESSRVAEESSRVTPVAESSTSEDESSEAVNVPTKVNPVPASPLQTADYLKTCAFVGEVDVYNMGQYGQLGSQNCYASSALNLTNYGKEYVMLDGTTIHIQSAMYGAQCPMYLMFGTDDLLAGQPADQTADQFTVLLNMMKASAPEAEIFVLSIPPVTDTVSKKLDNAVIDEYNSLLLQAANDANVYFVDTNTALKNNAGQLDWVYCIEDGIHLNEAGTEVLLNYVLSHVPE